MKKISLEDMITLRRNNHTVYGYIRKGILVVDGYKRYVADKYTCLMANVPDSEFNAITERY